MSNKEYLLDIMKETGALLSGHFLLSSGMHSASYMQCARLLRIPQYASFVGEQLARLVGPYKPDFIVAPAIGGLIIGHELAGALDIPFLFCERQDGKMTLRRFDRPGKQRFFAVEDVITTGGSVNEVGEVMQEAGSEWLGTACLADRSNGKAVLPHPVISLLQISFPIYVAADCPLCAEGKALVKPGSR